MGGSNVKPTPAMGKALAKAYHAASRAPMGGTARSPKNRVHCKRHGHAACTHARDHALQLRSPMLILKLYKL